MKMMKIKLLALAVVVLTTATNCDDGLKEINVNPIATTGQYFDPNYLLSTAQFRYSGSTDFSYETWRSQLIHFSTMTQHLATTIPYWAGDKYTLNEGYQASYFDIAYEEQVKFVVDALKLAKDRPASSNLYNILRIWKVVIFHRITDIYGDVPYFQAGQGAISGNFTPVYDTQQEIYDDMIKELREAAAALDPALDKPTGDMIYGGDIPSWRRFAYSMMLRLGTRLSKVNPTLSQQIVEEAAEGGVMQSIDDNAYIIHDVGGRPTENRIARVFAENLGERTQVKWSKTFIDQLQSTNDPRLSVLAELPPVDAALGTDPDLLTVGNNDPALQQGLPNGYNLGAPRDVTTEPDYPGAVAGADATDPLGNYSRPNHSLFMQPTTPTVVMTYAEVELMLAEAAERNYDVEGDAASHYNAGVRAAMKSLADFNAVGAIDDSEVDVYLAANPYVEANGLEMIAMQYWLATVWNEYETFANWRRTGLPNLVPVNHPNSQSPGVIPRRFQYPVSEANTNSLNYQAALGRMGGSDSWLNRVWWDAQ